MSCRSDEVSTTSFSVLQLWYSSQCRSMCDIATGIHTRRQKIRSIVGRYDRQSWISSIGKQSNGKGRNFAGSVADAVEYLCSKRRLHLSRCGIRLYGFQQTIQGSFQTGKN